MSAPPDHIPEALRAALADRYRLARELGVGGMATVYLAHDLRHDRDVALKVLRDDVADSVGAERFLREIRIAARLAHPHILPLFDSGCAEGLLWYAMPVVTGESLRDRLDRDGPLPVAEAVRLSAEVAEALAHAHAQGIVHRDIKPENILLQAGHALVADFGIGKAASEAEAGQSLTQAGLVVGTPAYMSPEQAVGELVDGRSDLYALGCVLYEMLLGEPPFTGPSAQAILAKRFVQLPADVSALREGVPRAVAAAVQQALQRTPRDRPAAQEWAQVLQGALAAGAEPIVASTAPASSIAVLPFNNLSDDRENEYFGDGIAEEIITALARVPGLVVAARVSAAVYKGRQVPLATIGRELGVATVLLGSVRRAGSRVRITAQLVAVADGYQLWSERYDRDLTDVFAVQDEIAGAIAGRLELQFAAAASSPVTTEDVEVYDLLVRGRVLARQRGRPILEAARCYERALAVRPGHVDALVGLAAVHRLLGQYYLRPAAEAYGDARHLIEQALALAPEHAEGLGVLAMIRVQCRKPVGPTVSLFERSLALDPRQTDLRSLYAAHGLGIGSRGARDADAEREARRALAEDPLNPVVASLGALTLALLGRTDEAPPVIARAAEASPESFLPAYVRCWTLQMCGRAAEALAVTEEAMDRFGRHAFLLQNLVWTYASLGDRRRAEAVRNELVARSLTARVPHASLALSAIYLGDLDTAIAEAYRSLAANDAIVPQIWWRFAGIDPLYAHPGYPALAAAVEVAE